MDETEAASPSAREAELKRSSHARLQVWLEGFSNRLKTRLDAVAAEVHQVVDGMNAVELNLQNAYNSFRHLSTSQFIENRVHEDDETEQSFSASPRRIVHQRSESEVLSRYKDAVATAWTTFQRSRGNAGCREKRILPFIIGTEDFMKDSTCGLGGLRSVYNGEDDSESDGDADRRSLTSDFIDAVAPAEHEPPTIDSLYFDHKDSSLEPAVSAALDFKAMLEAALRNPSLPYDGGTDGSSATGGFGKYDTDEYSLQLSVDQTLSDSPRTISTMVDIIGRTMSTMEESKDEIHAARSQHLPVIETLPPHFNVAPDIPFRNLLDNASVVIRPGISRPSDIPCREDDSSATRPEISEPPESSFQNFPEDASFAIRPEISGPPEIRVRHFLEDGSGAIRPEISGPPEIRFRNFLEDASIAIRSEISGPLETRAQNLLEDASTAISSEISGPPHIPFRNCIDDTSTAIRHEVPGTIKLPHEDAANRRTSEELEKQSFQSQTQSLLNAELKKHLSSGGGGKLVATSKSDSSSSFSGGLFEDEGSDTGSLGRGETAIPNSNTGPTVPDELFQSQAPSVVSRVGITDSLDVPEFSPLLPSVTSRTSTKVTDLAEDFTPSIFDDGALFEPEGFKPPEIRKSLEPNVESSGNIRITNALPLRQAGSFAYKGLFDDDDDGEDEDEDEASSILFGRPAPKVEGQSSSLGASSSISKSLLGGMKPSGMDEPVSFSPLFESKHEESNSEASSDADIQDLTNLSTSHSLK